jgi:hypothetical protein
MNTEQEVRPCPHCGMPVTLQTSKTLGDRLFVIACPNISPCANSGLGTYVVAGKRDEAIAAWNRRSSDEQAEVVGWAYERLTHLMIAGEDRWIKHLSETEPRPSDNIRNVRRLYASPPAVAAGGVTAEGIVAALVETEFHRSQIQGFYAKEAGTHYIRDCTKPHDQQRIWSARSNEGSDYDLMHSRMMERIELERWRIVLAALAVGDEGIREAENG